MFKKAVRFKSKLRMALVGPTGAGKTYSSLKIAQGLGTKIALIDTEHGSARKYSHICNFDVLELASFSPETFMKAIEGADQEGYEVLIIDSLSHAWMGKDGVLEYADNVTKRSKSGNSFAGWREATPLHNRLIDCILSSKCHIIVTMRAKMEYVLETNAQGKNVPRKVGLQPVQRDGMEYEFDVVGDLDLEKNFIITKTRCDILNDRVIHKPDQKLGEEINAWLMDAEDIPPPPPPPARISKEQLGSIVDYFGALVTARYSPKNNEDAKKWDFLMKFIGSSEKDITEEKATGILEWLREKHKIHVENVT